MNSIVLYHNPKENVLHTLVCAVKEDGTHTIIRSEVSWEPMSFSLEKRIQECAKVVGSHNVRAFTVSEVRED